jgi:hypothetical protein
MTPPQIPSKTSRYNGAPSVYEKSRIGQSVGNGKRHVPVLDPEPSWKVGRFAAQDRPHRVGPAPTVGFRFMSSANSPSGLCGRQAVPHARPRGALSRSGAPVRPTRRRREPLWLARPRHSLRPSWSSHQVACARAAIHLASIQMGEHAQFGPLNGGSGPGLTVALRSFPPVNS